jgi:hypothetical protein
MTNEVTLVQAEVESLTMKCSHHFQGLFCFSDLELDEPSTGTCNPFTVFLTVFMFSSSNF